MQVHNSLCYLPSLQRHMENRWRRRSKSFASISSFCSYSCSSQIKNPNTNNAFPSFGVLDALLSFLCFLCWSSSYKACSKSILTKQYNVSAILYLLCPSIACFLPKSRKDDDNPRCGQSNSRLMDHIRCPSNPHNS